MHNALRRDTEKSVRWIVSILQNNHVPFVIAGGFAARVYGSTRPLNDIDIDIPHASFEKILPHIAAYITYGPQRYVDAKWDLPLITLMHNGQEIDISAGDKVKIFDSRKNVWVDIAFNPENAVPMDTMGMTLPILPAAELIAYKSLLDGDHQQVDIAAARRFLGL